MPRRATPTNSVDGQLRMDIPVTFRLDRDQIYRLFRQADATFGHHDDKPMPYEPTYMEARKVLIRQLEDDGLNALERESPPADEYDEHWCEAMTAAIWGE